MTDQLGLFGGGEVEASPPPARPVFSIDPDHQTNGQRIADMASMGYLPEPVLDATYGLVGGMWKVWRPGSLIGGDIDPDKAPDVVLDVMALPFPDDAFATVVFDPPYKTQGGDSVGKTHAQYVAQYGKKGDLRHNEDLWVTGLPECLRVASKSVIVKCQDQVDRTARVRWQTIEIATEAWRQGWAVKDMLHLMNPASQPGVVRQRHSRRNYSTFVVLRPQTRMERDQHRPGDGFTA